MTFASIFLDFTLPNATTWLVFSLLLAVALFFRFTRFFCVRNWDVVTLFLLVPGLLLLIEADRQGTVPAESATPIAAVQMTAAWSHTQLAPAPGISGAVAASTASAPPILPGRLGWFGYLWLLVGSAYFFLRCLFDLVLVRRPALEPNLNLSGLIWLSAAMFICMVAIALRKPPIPTTTVGKTSAAVEATRKRAEDLVRRDASAAEAESGAMFWLETLAALACHLAIVVGLALMGLRHFQDLHGGVAAATFYLLLPYTAYHVDQVHHLLPAALILWAVVSYRRPTLAGSLLGLAFGTSYLTVLLLPPWLSFYWRRGQGRFLTGFLVVGCLCLAAVAGILYLEGELSLRIKVALALSDWQPWKQPDPLLTSGFWTGVRWAPAYRLPVFIAFLIFVFTTAFWPRPKNLAHLMALSTAVLLGIQFWYADRGGVYVLWYLPLLLIMVFRPNLVDREAAPLPADGGWPTRFKHTLGSVLGRWLRLPPVKVPSA